MSLSLNSAVIETVGLKPAAPMMSVNVDETVAGRIRCLRIVGLLFQQVLELLID